MKHIQFPLAALLCILLLSACHSLPKHARYIPEDAAVVVGVHTDAISKKVAWSAITGSKLLDELKENAKNAKGKEALSDIENSGIDFMSTLYFCAKPDKRFAKEARMNIVVPLENAGKWEAFVKKVFPAAAISKVKDRSEALLDTQAYAAWTDRVLIISNMAVTKTERQVVQPAPEADTTMGGTAAAMDDNSFTTEDIVVDRAMTASEMDAMFGQDEAHSITANKRFKQLEGDGHDITVFIAYGRIMDSYAGSAGMGMLGPMMGANMWKNSAMATGIDFEKGKINGIMQYYPSDSMKEVAKLAG